MRFNCRYSGRNDYRKRGTTLNTIELPNGERVGSLFAQSGKEGDLLKSFGIVIRREVKQGDGEEEITCAVEITDPEKAFPLRIAWEDSDIYSASGCGTSGSSDAYISSYTLNGDEVEESIKRGWFDRR